jgi:hypothetical protein
MSWRRKYDHIVSTEAGRRDWSNPWIKELLTNMATIQIFMDIHNPIAPGPIQQLFTSTFNL